MSTSATPVAPQTSGARSGVLMAVSSMACIQVGLAVSVGLIGELGPAGVSWLRLAWAGVILLVLARPRPSDFTAATFRACLLLGVVTAGITVLFMAAASRLPLGTAVALEFLGPLGVAVVRGHGPSRRWAFAAGAGVLLLTQPWEGSADLIGVGFALAAAGCWAAYILLTQHVGDGVEGIKALAVSMPMAGLTATVVVLVLPGQTVFTNLSPGLILVGLGLAVLVPVVPFILELLALRRLTAAVFGTLMCLEPVFGVIIGLVALHQVPNILSAAGVGLVVAAGIGVQRTAARDEPAPSLGEQPNLLAGQGLPPVREP